MDVGTNRLVGKHLKKLRKASGLTQQEVAQRCDVAQSAISKLESGERSLLFYELFEYSRALGIDSNEFFASVKHVLLHYKG